MTAVAVDPERLLKELRALWRDLGKQDQNGVLRACAMTFIVVVDEARDANILGETIANLMHEHPSRAIVIRVRDCPGQVMEARVFAQCWMPFGRRQQICCEQVEIISSPASLGDVASVVRGLIVPDLPSILFCPSENLWWMPEFRELFPLAGKIIVDSCAMPDSERVLEFWGQVPTATYQLGDLIWGRLTPWRQAVARIFEDKAGADAVRTLQSVTLRYSGTAPTSGILYLAGWFQKVLGAQISVVLASGEGAGYSGVSAIELQGPGLQASVAMKEGGSAETKVNGQTLEVILFPTGTEEAALRQELAVQGRDPLFEALLPLAAEFRGSL
ncbi:MAG: glucose-6-phosphate dehydrogenase assembly protein OpcA [Bryobacteraceae bacterium]|nr:glucose-6-phosphate dehydrogenase assembly protein OpcA [Bryobacteraceae bacterium]